MPDIPSIPGGTESSVSKPDDALYTRWLHVLSGNKQVEEEFQLGLYCVWREARGLWRGGGRETNPLVFFVPLY